MDYDKEYEMYPTRDHLLVALYDTKKITSSGLELFQDESKIKIRYGTVLAVGPGRENKNGEIIPLTVQEKDDVMFADKAGTAVKLCENWYLVIEEKDILAIMDDFNVEQTG